MPTEDSKLSGDPVKIAELIKEYSEDHQQYVEAMGTVIDKSIDLNKDLSSFHERLLLISLGTIGLSVSALVSLGSKMAGNPVAKQTFVHYIASAWVLLFVSAWMSRNVMAFVLRINKVTIEDWSKHVHSYYIHQMARSLNKLSQTLSGTLTLESQSQDASVAFKELGQRLQQELTERNKLAADISVAVSDAKRLKVQAHIAVWCMQVALLLLCVAAIKLFLLF